MNQLCHRAIVLLYVLAVLVFAYIVFWMADPMKWLAVGLALLAIAWLLKTLCCPCNPRPAGSGTLGQTKM